jgi:hypothetical protein
VWLYFNGCDGIRRRWHIGILAYWRGWFGAWYDEAEFGDALTGEISNGTHSYSRFAA